MGIKPSYIKTLGNELVVKQRENFTNNFEENKQQLEKSAVIGSSSSAQISPTISKRTSSSWKSPLLSEASGSGTASPDT